MILRGYTTDVGVGGVREVGGCPFRKDIRRQRGRSGQNKYKYVTISDRA